MPRNAPIEPCDDGKEVVPASRHDAEIRAPRRAPRRHPALRHALFLGKVAAIISVSFLLSMPVAARLVQTGLFAVALAFIGGPFLSS